jgi:hypothetical protein
MKPMYRGRFSRGRAAAMIERAPFNKPADPRPATALPIMNMFDEVATPQISEPSSKRAKNQRKVHL